MSHRLTMVNLLPEEFRRQEEQEHKAALAEEKQQENVVLYTQAQKAQQEMPHSGKNKAEKNNNTLKQDTQKSAQSAHASVKLPSFVNHGSVKKNSFIVRLAHRFSALFYKQKQIQTTVPAHLKPQKSALKAIDFGGEVKKQGEKKNAFHKSVSPRMEVNLISSDVLIERSEHTALVRLALIAIASACVVGAAWLTLQFQITQKQLRIDQLISQKWRIEREVSSITLETQSARKIQLRIDAAQALVQNNTSWLTLLKFFEANTLAAVSFDGIAFDKSDPYTYALKAQAPTVSDMLSQWRVFEESPFIESATISGYSKEDEDVSVSAVQGSEEGESTPQQSALPAGISFTFDIVFKPTVFEKK